MAERRYDEHETRTIFERASSVQRTQGQEANSTGLTPRELQEIGAEVGISPESIAQAALSVDLPGD